MLICKKEDEDRLYQWIKKNTVKKTKKNPKLT
ncbi:hypothetical protein SAMN05421636_105123 [Pricia antarctica]|uniref:Uncharacterized protein n=1 Tax=Pricia antarctica TaxID=641691 RepID=A0A1G7D155_9FLAO|nr:hypothetical protein SAMN05421636_105123 [Pricia antarctica]